MPRLARLANAVLNYRLGYNLQRPYPWKWTTPIVAITFLLLTGILTIINIPLSAYDVVSEFTYTPNDTLPNLPFSALIPSSIRRQPGQFTPQIFREGDMIRPNGSLFTYTINQIYDSNNLSETVSSFLYYNNPLSSCDISVIRLSVSSTASDIGWGSGVTGSALISCWSPALFTMTWSFLESDIRAQTVYQPWWKVLIKLNKIWQDATAQNIGNLSNSSVLDVVIRPCCSCDDTSETWIQPLDGSDTPPQFGGSIMSYSTVLDDVRFILNDHPPCEENGQAAKFQDLYITLSTTLPSSGSLEMTTEGVFADDFEDSTPALRLAVRNAMRATFHIARLDFGIVRGNQIYQSSAFFDENMEDYSKTWPSDLIENIFWAALCSPCDVWPTVPSAARTVVLSYLRPVFQLKPIGSAIVSVFVATFDTIAR